ncbi:MAG: ABC transporter permease [Acidimicrobiales bacterium]|jgi:spermidine/putrescine transport system permease protein|nr:ABC transporter permease [Acidimicrobiales bacterium]
MTLLDEPVYEEEIPEVEEATLEFEAAAIRAESRRGFLMALPAYAYLVTFFAVPLVIVSVYSFATRNRYGGTDLSGWNLDAYRKLGEPIVRDILFRSLWIAMLTTFICLLIGYPFAYFLATRRPAVRNLMLVFVMIPFWSNFLVRNYAWRVLLGRNGLVSDGFELVGLGPREFLFTRTAVMIGLVYGFLPFMILPLYASIERIDSSLLEASRDLYASGWQTFRRVLLPLSMPGVIAGSILTFVPSLGAYVTPEILGGAKSTLLGSYIVSQFLTARNWPVGASLSFVLMAVMLVSTVAYFRSGARNL